MPRQLGLLAISCLFATSACQRDRSPAPSRAPAEASEQAVPPAASRPLQVERVVPDSASTGGVIDCFGERQVTPVEQWLRVGALGDLNGDGKLDAVIDYDVIQEAGGFIAYVAVYLGDGDGGFRETAVAAVGPMSYSVALADLDEDGHLDVLAPSVKERKLVVFRGLGDGTLAPPRSVRTGPRPGQIVTGDFDGDLHVDVLLTLEREYQVLLGDGKGGLRALPVVKVEDAPEPPGVGDFDGDGVLDLWLVHNDSLTAYALRGRGDGTFERIERIGGLCDAPYSVTTGDVHADGRADFAFSCLRSDLVRVVHTGRGSAGFTLEDVAVDAGQAIAMGDVTGDGVPDVVAVGQRPGRPATSNMTLIAGSERGRFVVRSRAVIEGHVGDPLLGDVNGDGRLDLVASAWHGRRPGHIAVWFGTPCGER